MISCESYSGASWYPFHALHLPCVLYYILYFCCPNTSPLMAFYYISFNGILFHLH